VFFRPEPPAPLDAANAALAVQQQGSQFWQVSVFMSTEPTLLLIFLIAAGHVDELHPLRRQQRAARPSFRPGLLPYVGVSNFLGGPVSHTYTL